MTRLRLLAVVLLLFGCGGDDDTTAADGPQNDGPAGNDSMADSMMGGMVPDPGTQMNPDWADMEPNDDPEHATPEGIMLGPIWAGFVMPYTTIDSATDTDFYVFRTSATPADLANISLQVCATPNVMDMYLYSAPNMMQGPVIAMDEGTDTGCVAVLTPPEGSTLLTADTVYLVEVRAQPGATGLPVMYGA